MTFADEEQQSVPAGALHELQQLATALNLDPEQLESALAAFVSARQDGLCIVGAQEMAVERLRRLARRK